MGKRNFDFVASIGEICATAGILNNLSLRQESSPLDWVGFIDFPTRIKLIINGFPDFMAKKYLKRLGINEANPDKDSYVHTLYGTKIIHDFPSNQPLDQSWPAINAKYERRIKRFLNHLRKDKTLLVYVAADPLPQELLSQSINAINQKYAPNKIALLYIEHNPNLSMTQTVEKTIGDNLFWVQLNNTPTVLTDAFLKLQGNIPVVNDVVCRYALGTPYQHYVDVFCSRKRQVLFSITRLLVLVCPFSEQRKDWRRFLYRKIIDWLS